MILKLLGFLCICSLCLFYGFLVGLQILWKFLRHPTRLLTVKPRKSPPPCLEDEGLGVHAYLRTKDVKIHYVANGDRNKPLMLFLHGFPEFWYSWRYQLKEFSKDYRVVAVDMRGYGDSDKPRGVANYALDCLTGDIRDMIPALGYSSCVLVSHDWGGVVAWRFAMDYPELVDKLIVMNCPHPKRFQEVIKSSLKQFLMSWYVFLFQLPFLAEFNLKLNDYKGIEEVFVGKDMGVRNREMITKEDLEAFKYNCQREGALTAMVNYYRAMFRYPPKKPKTRTILSPTLLIWGTEDKALDIALTEGLEKYVSDITVKLVPNASHWVQQDRPDVTNRLMREFLNRK